MRSEQGRDLLVRIEVKHIFSYAAQLHPTKRFFIVNALLEIERNVRIGELLRTYHSRCVVD